MSDNAAVESSTLNEATIRKGASIIGLVLAFFMPPVGLVLSIGTLIWARRSGERGGLSIAGIVLSIVMIALAAIVSWWLFNQFLSLARDGGLNLDSLCAYRDRWGWLIDSLRYACP